MTEFNLVAIHTENYAAEIANFVGDSFYVTRREIIDMLVTGDATKDAKLLEFDPDSNELLLKLAEQNIVKAMKDDGDYSWADFFINTLDSIEPDTVESANPHFMRWYRETAMPGRNSNGQWCDLDTGFVYEPERSIKEMKHDPVTIGNEGQKIVSTNFFESQHATDGLFFLSGNAGAWRLLVPSSQEHLVPEMKTGHFVTMEPTLVDDVSVISITFDDGSDAPFVLTIDARQMDRRFTPGETTLLAYNSLLNEIAQWAVRETS